jgi:hypothetical protein
MDRYDDRNAITELLYRYAYHFDRSEPELVAELFTEECVIDYGPEFAPILRRADIVARIGPGLREIFAATSHHISNVLIEFDGADTAHSVAYVYAWHRYRNGSPDGHLWGQYHTQLRRVDTQWQIAELTLRVAAVADFHRAAMHQIERRPGVAVAGEDPG